MQLLIFIYTMMACWYVNRSHFRGFVAQVTVKVCGSLVYTSVPVEKFDCEMHYLWTAIFILSIFPYLKFFKFINTEVKILESCIVFGTEIKYMYSVLLHFQHKNEICGSISAFHCKKKLQYVLNCLKWRSFNLTWQTLSLWFLSLPCNMWPYRNRVHILHKAFAVDWSQFVCCTAKSHTLCQKYIIRILKLKQKEKQDI